MSQGQQDPLAVAVDSGNVVGSQVVGGNEGERLDAHDLGLCMAMRHQGCERLDLTLLLRKGAFLGFQRLPDSLCALAGDRNGHQLMVVVQSLMPERGITGYRQTALVLGCRRGLRRLVG